MYREVMEAAVKRLQGEMAALADDRTVEVTALLVR